MKPQEREQEVKAQKERQQQRQYQQKENDIAVSRDYLDSVVSRNKGQGFKASSVDQMFLKNIPDGKRFVKEDNTFDVTKWNREKSSLRPRVQPLDVDVEKGQGRTIYKPK